MIRICVLALLLTGCFDPSYSNVRCGASGECPNGYVCVVDTCQRPQKPDGGDDDDGGSSADDGGMGDTIPIDSVASGPPRIIHITANHGTTDRLMTTIPATAPGTLLVVVSTNSNQANAVDNLRDNKQSVYMSNFTRADLSDTTPNNIVEIFWSLSGNEGVTDVTFQQSTSSTRQVWIFEIAGVPLAAPVVRGMTPNGFGPVQAPIVSAPAESIVISVAGVIDNVTGISSSSPFIAQPILDGSDAAYFITPSAGSYGALWDGAIANTHFAALTVAFAGAD